MMKRLSKWVQHDPRWYRIDRYPQYICGLWCDKGNPFDGPLHYERKITGGLHKPGIHPLMWHTTASTRKSCLPDASFEELPAPVIDPEDSPRSGQRERSVCTLPRRNRTGVPNRTRPAEAELHFTEGVLNGLKLIGFTVWERRTGGGRNVTFPARTYSVNGERRSFALLRPIADATSQDQIREAILAAYAEFEEQAAVAS